MRVSERLTGEAMRFAPALARKNIAVIDMHPGLVATEVVAMRVKEAGLDNSVAVSLTVPSRMLNTPAACSGPNAKWRGWV
jgi:hypothetical protein